MGKWIIVIISVCVHVCFVDNNSKSKTAVCRFLRAVADLLIASDIGILPYSYRKKN